MWLWVLYETVRCYRQIHLIYWANVLYVCLYILVLCSIKVIYCVYADSNAPNETRRSTPHKHTQTHPAVYRETDGFRICFNINFLYLFSFVCVCVLRHVSKPFLLAYLLACIFVFNSLAAQKSTFVKRFGIHFVLELFKMRKMKYTQDVGGSEVGKDEEMRSEVEQTRWELESTKARCHCIVCEPSKECP